MTSNAETVWHLKLPDACQIDLELRRINFSDPCEAISISAGPYNLNGSKTLLLTESQPKSFRVAHSEALVIPYVAENSNIEYEFFYNCSTSVADPPATPVPPTPFHAFENATISACLVNLNASTVQELFDKDNATHQQFLQAIADMAKDAYIWIRSLECDREVTFVAHFQWPVYGLKNCDRSSKRLPRENRYCFCFNLSVEVVNGSTYCDQTLLTDEQLKALFKADDDGGITVTVGDDEYLMIVLQEEVMVLYKLLSAIAIFFGLVVSGVVYKYASTLTSVPDPVLETRGSAFEEEVAQMGEPSEITNPLYASASYFYASNARTIDSNDGFDNRSYVADSGDSLTNHPRSGGIGQSLKSLAQPQTTQLEDITEEEEENLFGFNRSNTASFEDLYEKVEDLYEKVEDLQFDKSINLEDETKL